jgi:hypothetical protein
MIAGIAEMARGGLLEAVTYCEHPLAVCGIALRFSKKHEVLRRRSDGAARHDHSYRRINPISRKRDKCRKHPSMPERYTPRHGSTRTIAGKPLAAVSRIRSTKPMPKEKAAA